MKGKLSSVFNIVIAVFLLIAVNSFCKPCHGMMEMPCERSKMIACIVSAVITALNIANLFIKNKSVRAGISALSVSGGVLLILTPKFGKCQIASMACNMKTFPVLKLGGILIITFTVVFTIYLFIQDHLRNKSHAHTK